jgi:DNA gyrase inhibitor GyrI
MKFKIENVPSSKVAYIRKVGPYGEDNFKTMMMLKKWARDHQLLKDSIIFARIHDNPMITPPENCRYDACVVIDEDLKIERLSLKVDFIHGGRYAVLEIEHTAAGVQKAWDYVFTAIAQKRVNYKASQPILERYTDELVKKNRCQICVPINE